MYIREKTAKGHTYYQIVRGYRDKERVRHETVVSLGPHREPAAALAAMRAELKQLKAERRKYPRDKPPAAKLAADRVKRLDGWIARLGPRIAILAGIISTGALEKPK